MEACIEALYTIDGESDKRKTLEMIRVLKGAISVSKSRTGEVIYRYNRHEKKSLARMMAKYDRDTVRSRVNIDSQKRDVLRKWNLVFGRQRKLSESIRGFNDMVQETISSRHLFKFDDEEEDEADGQEEDEEEARRLQEEQEEEEARRKMPNISDPRARRLGARPSGPQGLASTPVVLGVLPKLNMGGALHNTARIESEEEERLRREKEAEEERKRKAKELPRFDKELMESFLTEQKSLHEDLLTRNVLLKIKSHADKDHEFFKYRLKSKLPDSPQSLLHQIERDRSMSVMSLPGGASRPCTRSTLSTRHSTRPGRLSRQKSSVSSKSFRSTRSDRGVGSDDLEGAEQQMINLSLTERGSSPSGRSQMSLPRLERSKTVHFS